MFALPLLAVVASGVAITALTAGAGPALPPYVDVGAAGIAARSPGRAPATGTAGVPSSTGPSSTRGGGNTPGGPRPPGTTGAPTTGAPTTGAPTTGAPTATGTSAPALSPGATTVVTVVVRPRLEGDNGRPQVDDNARGERSAHAGRGALPLTTSTRPDREVGHDG